MRLDTRNDGGSGNGIMALIKQVEAVKVEQEMREAGGLFMTRGILSATRKQETPNALKVKFAQYVL